MILAAGRGTRLHPLTEHKPKALVTVGGRALLELVIERLKKFGVTSLIINVHHHARQIIDFVKQHDSFGIHIEFSVEEELLDTGGGLKKARPFFDDADYFLLHNADVLTDMDYSRLFTSLQSSSALACLAIRRRKTSRYLLFDPQFRLCGWQNVKTDSLRLVKPDLKEYQPFSFMGVQALSVKIFDYLPERRVFSLIDAYLQIAEKNKTILGLAEEKARWLDLGKMENLKQAEQLFSDFIGEKPNQ